MYSSEIVLYLHDQSRIWDILTYDKKKIQHPEIYMNENKF